MRALVVLTLLVACSDPPRPQTQQPRPEPPVREVTPPTPPEPELTFATPVRLALDDERAIDQALEAAIAAGDLPGAVVRIGRRDGVVFERAYGMASLEPEQRAMQPDMLFDLASVTKVITTIAVLRLHEQGAIHLDRAVDRRIPELAGWGITPRHLLLHTAGFRPVNPLSDYEDDRDASLARALRNAPERPPGTYTYSDLSFIALGTLVERITGKSLAEVFREQVFEPVGAHARFNPGAHPNVVPTEYAARRGDPPPMIHGDANDPRAWRLGGIAGHAGLFARAEDLGRIAEALLRGELLRPETIRLMHTAVEVARPNGQLVRRGLGVGMDDRRAEGWSAQSFGHGGYTGTWLWIDPERDLYAVLLAHRVHPHGEGRSGPIRSTLGRLIHAATITPPRDNVVRLGIDVLRAQGLEPLEGKRVAVLTNGAARARDGTPTWRLLQRHTNLRRVFTPEHGLGADREGAVGDQQEGELQVVSLFGPQRTPQPEALADVDVVLVDLQDVGARFYTYGATMGRMMQAAADANVTVWVLDRPNPLGGEHVAGPMLQEAQRSFVNHQPGWPVQHAMTMGEMARLLRTERELDVELEVVQMQGWSRSMRWDDTGLRWTPPSPNLRTTDQVFLYPGVAFVEGTNVSVGRGTDHPFELVGAPWMNADAVLAALPPEATVGLTLSATRFRPTSARHRARWCRGIRIVLTDREQVRPLRFGLALLRALHEVHPDDWDSERAVRIVGDERITTQLDQPLESLEQIGADELEAFRTRRRAALLY